MATARSYREGWLTSCRINALGSDSAELFLFRLGLKADKNGIYHGEPELLRTAVYPLQVSRRRLADVTRYRDECAKAGLLRLWNAADGRPYVQILKFRQKTPLEKPIHPLPPGEPDEAGQEHLGLRVEPPPRPPPTRKRSKGNVWRAERADTHHEFTDGLLPEVQGRWPQYDVAAALRVARQYVRNRRGAGSPVTVEWFEEFWMPQCVKRREDGDGGRVGPVAEPVGFAGWYRERYEKEPGKPWADMSVEHQDYYLRLMKDSGAFGQGVDTPCQGMGGISNDVDGRAAS
jgi:hypothetical protein